MFLPDSGGYILKSEDVEINLDPDKLVTISLKDDRIKVKAQGQEHLFRGIVRLIKLEPNSSFRIRVGDDERIYDGNMEFRIHQAKLFAINEVDLERYVGGVVESESGHVNHLEFLKAQAVIARTYALKHKGTHQDNHYDLNDEVDAQAFHSIAYSKNSYAIWKAVYSTKREIILDQNDELIISAYHSNSGGQTVNSEDAWTMAVPYLRATVDSFSVGMPHYHWERQISKLEWQNYFVSVFGPIDMDSCRHVWLPDQKTRLASIDYGGKSMRLKDLRLKFKLPSSFFDIEEDGDQVQLIGRGFGHGVGLSQEGAIKMAEMGYSYREILNYYYIQIQIVVR